MVHVQNHLLLELLIVFLLAVIVHSECPKGWIHYEESCYLFSSHSYNWFDAQSSCRSHNARLAEPLNMNHTEYLVSMTKSIGRGFDYWLGGRDDVVEGEWRWSSSDEEIRYKPWWPNQPDNAGGNEDCLEMVKSYNYKWNDLSCTDTRNYICEKMFPGTENEIIG